jgi:hypothetical protein
MKEEGGKGPNFKEFSLSTYVANLINNSTEVALGTAKAYRKVCSYINLGLSCHKSML